MEFRVAQIPIFNLTFSDSGLYPYYCEDLGGPSLSGCPAPSTSSMPAGVFDESYNGVILSGGSFVAIIVGVVGGAILGVILLVVSIAAFKNRHAILAPLHLRKH